MAIVKLQKAIVSPVHVIVTGECTTFANMARLDLVRPTEIIKKHAELSQLSKKYGFKISRKHKTLKQVKELEVYAGLEYKLYLQKFDKYVKMFDDMALVDEIDSQDPMLHKSYGVRDSINTMFFGSTKLSQYMSACRHILQLHIRATDGDFGKGAVIYV